MASCSTLKASSSTSNCDAYNYHVFMSFRGADTRNNFTDHLYHALVAYGIHTFRDEEELEKGGHIASNLWRAIEDSKIFIIIFSENYATSKWCLNELVKIIEYTTHDQDKKVMPVFYHVEPRDVRNQGGSFEKAFLEHAKDADQEKEKTIETWKEALKTAGALKGYDVKNESEVELIQRIREDIITRLNRKTLHLGDNIVGMDFHLEQLKSLIKTELDEVHMIGIYGTGGIGKTTIAMAIYNDISSQFDGSSFLKNVGGKGEDGLLKLQKTLLRDILKGELPKFNNTNEGINVIKDRLRWKRVLIVLDDVDQYEQLETLAGKYGWYGAKSIIIITTKDTHLLTRHGVKKHYEVQKLNLEKSTKLFNWWAFKQSTPKPAFESLSNSVLKYVDGLPIALKVLGGFLFGRSINEWNGFMHRLQEMPEKTIQSVLKVSYDKLDFPEEQSIFLDIACFFRGEDKDFVLRILGSRAEIGIQVLIDRCLITMSENKLDMHDLLQRMGQEIIRQEDPQEPGKRTRLWNLSDVNSVLTKNTGTQTIEGLFVEVSTSNRIQFSKDSFTKMDRLRLLKVYEQWSWENCEVDLPKDLEFPSFALKYFHFERYPLESLPANFHAKNLVELNLMESSIKQLWKENEILDNLKVINLSYSEDLVEIPCFSSVPNLEILILIGCSRLMKFPEIKGNMRKLRTIDLCKTAIEELPSSIGHLKALKHLYLSGCEILGSLPESICNLSSLETLEAEGCFELKGFPEIKDDMENLQMLNLSETTTEELPSSIGHLKALKHLDLSGCESLRSLPESICNLSSLETLKAKGCFKLEGFPEIKDDMENLQKLDLSETAIEELPSSIGHLKALKYLCLSVCKSLGSLPQSISNLSSLETLGLSETAIEELPSSIGHLKALEYLDLSGCKSLGSLPESICNLSSLKTLEAEGCFELKGFPEIKDDMENLQMLNLSETAIEELPSSIGHLKALEYLDLSGCKSLGSLPESICNLSSLKTLEAEGCFELKGFPEIKDDMENLQMLNLSETAIEELPSSIGHLKALEYLDLSGCKSLRSLPESICNLSSLKTLEAKGCFELKGFPEIKDDMENLQKLDLSKTAIEELPSSIGHLKALKHLYLSGCKSLRSLPKSICNLSSLETLNAGRCFELKGFPEIKDDMENLQKLDLSKTAIEELPSSIGHLKALKYLCLSGCKSLGSLPESICNLSSLETLEAEGCFELKGFPEIKDDMENLQMLNLSETAIEELPSSIGHLKALEYLDLSGCKSLRSLPESICNLSSLKTLEAKGCFELKGFPEIKDDMENLQKLDLSKTAIEELPSSIGHLKALKHLYLSGCKSLRSLPKSICNLSSLETLNAGRCFELKGFPEIKDDMENLQKLDLSKTAIEELPSSIGHLKALKYLCLSGCKSLGSLPESIFNLSSLETLEAEGCFELKGFPEIKDDMENLQMLNLSETAIEELPSSIGHLKALKHLYLSGCKSLRSLPESICNLSSLETLEAEGCFELEGFLEIKDDMENLQKLDLSETAIEELPSSIGHLKALKYLRLAVCKSLGSLPESICNLSSLETLGLSETAIEELPSSIGHLKALKHLDLSRCKSLRSLPESICNLSSFEILGLSETAIEELPSSIGHLKALKHLYLSGCKSLRSLPKSICNLSSLETLDAGRCFELEGFPEIKDDMENLQKLDLSETAIEELPSSIGHLKALKHLDLSRCKSLRSLPESICNLSSFEILGLSETAIEELPSSIGHLKALKHLYLSGCKSLRSLPESICNLSSLETLEGYGCFELKGFPEIKDDMENLQMLNLSETAIEELPSSIGHLKALNDLDLLGCKSLRSLPESICNLSSLETLVLSETAIEELPSSIGHLKALEYLDLSGCESLGSLPESICNLSSLETLKVDGCFELKGFPEIKDDMENLQMLNLSETAIEELPSSIGHLKALKYLRLAVCKSLGSLPESICNLSSLETLVLSETAIEELPSSIGHLKALEYLDLSGCESLGSLPESICNLSSLETLKVDGCFELKGFPEIKDDMENLQMLNLSETAIEELPSSIGHLKALKHLYLSGCKSLRSLPKSICNLSSLETLDAGRCFELEGFPKIKDDMENLQKLDLSETAIEELPSSIQSDVCYMSSGEASNRCINYFSSIPVNIIQLSKLRILYLSHCQKLLQIPELPPSLRILDVHACPCLETLSSPSSLLGFSLFRCFKSAIEEFECESSRRPKITAIIAGNKGIPEWISQQQKGSQITVELPMDWHQNKYFLGFALYSVYVPLDIESKEDPCTLECELNFHGHQYEFLDNFSSKVCSMDGPSSKFWPVDKFSFRHGYPCCHNGGESNSVWVVYYPKVAILNQYWSNEWRHLKASFHGKQAKVEECGFHLIYMPNILNTDSNTHAQSSFGTNHLLRENNGFNVKRSRDDAEDHQKEDLDQKRSRHF